MSHRSINILIDIDLDIAAGLREIRTALLNLMSIEVDVDFADRYVNTVGDFMIGSLVNDLNLDDESVSDDVYSTLFDPIWDLMETIIPDDWKDEDYEDLDSELSNVYSSSLLLIDAFSLRYSKIDLDWIQDLKNTRYLYAVDFHGGYRAARIYGDYNEQR